MMYLYTIQHEDVQNVANSQHSVNTRNNYYFHTKDVGIVSCIVLPAVR